MATDASLPRFKVCVVGDGGVGKTAWVKRCRHGTFETKYIATLGVEVQPVPLNTNYGSVVLNVWDCAGQEKFGGLRDGYYIQAQAGVVMIDLSSRLTIKNAPNWLRDLNRVCDRVPMVLVANKGELPDSDKRIRSFLMWALTSRFAKQNIPIAIISTKQATNLYAPFMPILEGLVGAKPPSFNMVAFEGYDGSPLEYGTAEELAERRLGLSAEEIERYKKLDEADDAEPSPAPAGASPFKFGAQEPAPAPVPKVNTHDRLLDAASGGNPRKRSTLQRLYTALQGTEGLQIFTGLVEKNPTGLFAIAEVFATTSDLADALESLNIANRPL